MLSSVREMGKKNITITPIVSLELLKHHTEVSQRVSLELYLHYKRMISNQRGKGIVGQGKCAGRLSIQKRA